MGMRDPDTIHCAHCGRRVSPQTVYTHFGLDYSFFCDLACFQAWATAHAFERYMVGALGE
jgi:recombinational DNA repair protein (RecF pathway)